MTALAVLWMFTEVACGTRSPLLGGEEELVGTGGVNARPAPDSPNNPPDGTLATGGVQSLAGSGGGGDAPEDAGRGRAELRGSESHSTRESIVGPGSRWPGLLPVRS